MYCGVGGTAAVYTQVARRRCTVAALLAEVRCAGSSSGFIARPICRIYSSGALFGALTNPFMLSIPRAAAPAAAFAAEPAPAANTD